MFEHTKIIPSGVAGEISKIDEELEELKDANSQGHYLHSIIECADIINSTGQFSFNKYGIPLILVILLCYIRKPYKILRRFVLGPKQF